MLSSKNTKIISEISCFFSSSEKGIDQLLHCFDALNLRSIKFKLPQANQTQHRMCDVLLILLLSPFFSLSNVCQLTNHSLKNYLNASKNTYYRFKGSSNINWRGIVGQCLHRILSQRISQEKTDTPNKARCLIIDDTDFEKSTCKTEHVGKIWSHVFHRTIWGFKGLFLGYWDGSSFFAVDFSLHKEKGKDKKAPFGLTAQKKKKQFQKKRDSKSHGGKREKELTISKITMSTTMIKRALRSKLEVDHILMDSWFFCEQILKFIVGLKQDIHLVSMAKMSNAKYGYQGRSYSAKELAQHLKQKKKVKRDRSIGLYVATTVACYKSIPIKMFFCKNSKRGKWHLLVTTDQDLGFRKAYEIYSIRWSIEVFFKEAKQHFKLGKCQSHNFDAQIADISMTIIGYNMLSLSKRIHSYETLGGLFREVNDKTIELTIAQRLWKIILEIIEIIAELVNIEINELVISIMKNSPKENKILKLLENNWLNQTA